MYFFSKTSILLLFVGFIALTTATKPLYQFNQRGFLHPHPDKAYRGGEDAFFSSKELLIVADGVGSWSDFGIDPAFYSRFLCSKGAELFEQNKTFYRQNLVELIANASNLNENIGSSTMVVITLNGEKLRTCFIGDSGFIILRLDGDKYKLFFEFKQQQHGFNFPFQLAMKEYYGDDPYLSVCQDFTIQEQDIIVVGSDGLFDNIFVTEIVNLINMNLKEEELFVVPETLADMAIVRGEDRKFESPFSIKAKEQMLKYLGGKLDDTTVVLAKIKRIEQKKEEITEAVKVEPESTSMKGEMNVEEKYMDTEQTSTHEVMADQFNEDQDWAQEEADQTAEEGETVHGIDQSKNQGEQTVGAEEETNQEEEFYWSGEQGEDFQEFYGGSQIMEGELQQEAEVKEGAEDKQEEKQIKGKEEGKAVDGKLQEVIEVGFDAKVEVIQGRIQSEDNKSTQQTQQKPDQQQKKESDVKNNLTKQTDKTSTEEVKQDKVQSTPLTQITLELKSSHQKADTQTTQAPNETNKNT